jgi:DNA-binding HxlR family transcriptional regulator
MEQLGRKWAIPIIRDLFNGKRRFKEFLESNPELSAKMLSTRLRDLQGHGIVEKRLVRTTPLLIEYGLTEKGQALGDVLYSLALFSIRFHNEEVFDEPQENVEEDLRSVFFPPR